MTQVSDIVERLRHPNAYLDGETYIVTSADREDPRQEEQRTGHRFRFHGLVHGSWTTPIAFGALLFDSSASPEHRNILRAINVAR